MYVRKSSEAEDRQALSIEAQLRELEALVERRSLKIKGPPIIEAFSARRPGRPLFTKMVEDLEQGHANGIVCWHLNRLARNPLDGGRIMMALADRTIEAIHTPERVYDGSGDDQLLMSLNFGIATKFSHDLSRDVKRGIREALEKGRWPTKPKLGYVRDSETGILVPDPQRFDAVRQLFCWRLNGVPVREILVRAREELKLRHPKMGRYEGKSLSISGLYRLLDDPFYMGLMRFNGETYDGTHVPAVTPTQFHEIQAGLRSSPPPPRAKRLFFTYRGLIRCGSCGAMVTAQHTTNRHGTRYTYYSCGRKVKRYRYCKETSVQEKTIEEAIVGKLRMFQIQPKFADKILEFVERQRGLRTKEEVQRKAELSRTLERIDRRLEGFRAMYADGLIGRDEFALDREKLLHEKAELAEQTKSNSSDVLKPLADAVSLGQKAVFEFEAGDASRRRRIVEAAFSNLVVKDKTLLISAKKSLDVLAKIQQCSSWRAVLSEVQTLINN